VTPAPTARAFPVCSLALAVLLGLPAGAKAESQDRPPSSLPNPVSASALREIHSPELVEELLGNGLVLLPQAGENADVEALVLFARPRSRVMRLLTQTGRAREYRPELKELRMLAVDERGALDEQRMRILFRTIVYRLRYRFDFDRARVEWHLARDFENDLERVEGWWQLHPMTDGRTLGHFGTVVRVGPALPAFLEKRATRSQVPETLERTRRWVDSDGRWRP